MTVVSLLLYINIVRNNLLNILPKAKDIALDSIQEAFILLDSDKKFLYANEIAEKIISQSAQNLELPFELVTDENGEIITSVKFNIPIDNYYNANISPLIDDKRKLLGYIIIIQNITESILLTKKLEEIAYTDALTGISNRQHFMSLSLIQFERTKRINNSSYIAMFDIDHFKKVNDTYGHIVGDKVLKCVAERVRSAIRPYDIFGRYGGEEFILFISDINEEDIKIQIERMRQAICDSPMIFDGTALTVSASFGVAPILPPNDLTEVIRIADEQLYKAKNAGRNRVMIAGVDN
jgi:diguanylate cyclase (GGDEF)-like protein